MDVIRAGGDYINRISYLHQKTYLQDDLLTKVDRAGMACSLEVRSPFMDVNLVEFANSIPGHYKACGLSTKKILKKAVTKIIPDQITDRPRKSLGVPIGSLIRNELKPELKRVFDKMKIRREGFFNYNYIERLLEEHFANKRDNHKQIWTLLMFEKWLEKFGQ